jgi:hypothetical protein
MKTVIVSIITGVLAGAIDAAPMLIRKMENASVFSAFVQYVVVSFVIFHIGIPGCPWFVKGPLVSFLLCLPIVILVSAKEKGAAVPIVAMSIILGIMISAVQRFFL